MLKITTRLDLSLFAFCVIVADDTHERPYFFNIPQNAQGRGADIFETCVAEALIRHEAWVSGKSQSFAVPATTTAPVAQKPVADVTPSVASPVAQPSEPAAPESQPATAKPVTKKPPVAKKAAATGATPKPQVVDQKFCKDEFSKREYGKVLTKYLGEGWSKDADFKAAAAEIARMLESEGFVIARDGEILPDFDARVKEELESRFDFA